MFVVREPVVGANRYTSSVELPPGANPSRPLGLEGFFVFSFLSYTIRRRRGKKSCMVKFEQLTPEQQAEVERQLSIICRGVVEIVPEDALS